MAVREYEIKADTTEAVESVEKLREELVETEKTVGELESKLKSAGRTAADVSREQADQDRELTRAKKDIIREIDRATGGYIQLGEKAFKAFKIVKSELGAGILKAKEFFTTFSLQTLILSTISKVKLMGQALKLAFTTGANAAKILRTALISTGIGALVVALGMVVAYWDEIKGAITGASKELQGNLELAEQNVQAQQAALDAISLQENSLRLQGKSEKEIRDLKIQQTEETIKALEAQLLAQKQLKDSQVAAAERNKNILQGIIRFLTLPLSLLLSTIDSIGSALGQDFGLEEGFTGGLAKLVFDPEEIAKEGDEAIEETEKQLAKLKSTRDGYLLDQRKEDEAAAKEAAEKAKAAADKAIKDAEDAERRLADAKRKAREEAEKNQLDLEKQFDEKVLQQQQSAEQQEINAVYDKFFALETAYADNAEALKMIEEQRNKELAEVNQKYRDQEAEEDAKELDKKRKQREELRNLVVDSANATIESLLKLNDIYDKDDEAAAKRAFDRSKKLQTLQAIINTAAGIMAAIGTPNVGEQISGANWAKAAAVALTGATQIATIQAAQFGGGKTAGGKTPSAPQAPTAQPNLNFNLVGASGVNQLAAAVGSQFNQPIRAYVVGSEVNSAQEMERKRIRTASFG
jgi:hypothetical protein